MADEQTTAPRIPVLVEHYAGLRRMPEVKRVH